jgi:type IV secretory pathway VirB10-like protein
MNRLLVPAASLLLAGTAWAQANQGQVFTCVDNAGRNLTSDRLIAQCMDREQRLLARDGTLIRVIPPQLTADERAEKDAREKRIAAEKQARAEAVRRDRLLVERYPNQEAHDKAREAALDDMRTATRQSLARVAELARERKPLDEEAEFYKGKALPAKLKQQIDANDAAASAQRDVQTQQRADMDRIGKRFDEELALLKRLWGGAAPGVSYQAAAAPAPEPKTGKPIKPTAAQSR